jgi:hypothetical protein
MATHEEVVESAQAEQILDSDIFQKALKNLKNDYVARWLSSTTEEEKDLRESLHKAILLIPEIEKHLRIIVEKGKLTKTHINKIRSIG